MTLNPPFHGWLILDKPLHMTSARAVALVKKKLGGIKVGHAGTLDPLATGVLPLALGEATKTISYIMAEKKQYTFEVTWGEQRSTDDREGEILKTSLHRPSEEEILALLPKFQGEIQQTPPLYSALKIQGQRACDRMRRQEEVFLATRTVTIFSLSLVKRVSKDCALFEMECGKGTYVRSLARDMGECLKCGAYASAIDRGAVGCFEKKYALSLEKLASLPQNVILRDYIKKIPEVLDDIPAVFVSELHAILLRQGQGIEAQWPQSLSEERQEHILMALDAAHNPVAFVRYREHKFWPERVFNI